MYVFFALFLAYFSVVSRLFRGTFSLKLLVVAAEISLPQAGRTYQTSFDVPLFRGFFPLERENFFHLFK